MSPEAAATASRLCAACGMCCDGTLFQIVRMQPGDSPAELGRLGMKIRCRDGAFHMEQPCAALHERRCTIYDKRPARCRQFHCQQLQRVESGTSTEAGALAIIAQTRALADETRALIGQCGLREDGQALPERYDRVMSTPVDAALEPELLEVRQRLEQSMQMLRVMLNRDFRPPPASE